MSSYLTSNVYFSNSTIEIGEFEIYEDCLFYNCDFLITGVGATIRNCTVVSTGTIEIKGYDLARPAPCTWSGSKVLLTTYDGCNFIAHSNFSVLKKYKKAMNL